MKTIDHKRVQTELLTGLARAMAEHGFSARVRNQSFYREIPGARWALHITFIRHPEDFDVTADVALRLHAVEDLVNQHTDLKDSEKRVSFTLGGELGQMSGGPPLRFPVTGETEVSVTAQAIVQAFIRIGMPFLRRYADLRSAYALLASKEPRDWYHCPIEGARCMRALAAAHILADRAEVARLISECGARLGSRDDPYLSQFRRLAAAVG